MSLTISMVISSIFIIIGFMAMLVMFKIQGHIPEKSGPTGWRKIHRILGYVFVIMYLIILIFMLKKIAAGSYEPPARITMHITLAVILFPILLVKILIARFYKRLSSHLISIGLLVFFLSFTVVFLTAGYRLLGHSNSAANNQSITTQQNAAPRELNPAEPGRAENTGQNLLQKKCMTCHNLERVKKAAKSRQEWTKTIERMINYTRKPDYLSRQEIDTLLDFLSE